MCAGLITRPGIAKLAIVQAAIDHAAPMSSKNIKKNQWFLNLHQFSSNENDCIECGASRATLEELRDIAADSLFSIGDATRERSAKVMALASWQDDVRAS
jgi:hypothetical protein